MDHVLKVSRIFFVFLLYCVIHTLCREKTICHRCIAIFFSKVEQINFGTAMSDCHCALPNAASLDPCHHGFYPRHSTESKPDSYQQYVSKQLLQIFMFMFMYIFVEMKNNIKVCQSLFLWTRKLRCAITISRLRRMLNKRM